MGAMIDVSHDFDNPNMDGVYLCDNDMNIPQKACGKLLNVFIDHELNLSDNVYLC